MTTKDDLWTTTLEALRGQMSKATFDTWLATSSAHLEDGILTVTIPNQYAKSWIDARLTGVILRAAEGLAGGPLTLRTIIGQPDKPELPPPGPGQVAIELIQFDPTQLGYVNTARYAVVFWQPLLGSFPFSAWLTLRAFVWSSDREGWPAIQTLADICAGGNRQKLLGRSKQSNREAQRGALQVLEEARIISLRAEGEGSKTRYFFRVLESLPLLTPRQVELLPELLQATHQKWLKRCQIDFEEWQQLEAESFLR